jgi:hypothetical protein
LKRTNQTGIRKQTSSLASDIFGGNMRILLHYAKECGITAQVLVNAPTILRGKQRAIEKLQIWAEMLTVGDENISVDTSPGSDDVPP